MSSRASQILLAPVAWLTFLALAAACAQCGGDDIQSKSSADGQAPVAPDATFNGGADGSVQTGDSSGGVAAEAAGSADAGGQGVDAASQSDAGSGSASPEAGQGSSDGGSHADAGAGAYSPCPTDGGACKILPLGDSITYGIQYAGAYRVELFHDALSAHQHITFVGDSSLANGPTMVDGVTFPQDNDGHSGWTIDQIAGLVPSPALQTNPDIVLLMIGTNDMYSQSQPVAQAPQRLGALLDKVIAGDARALLVVAQITPLQNSTWEASVVTYNAAIPPLIQSRSAAGKHIALVDMHTGFNVSTMLSSDGVHPNQTGYNHMGDVWYAAIKNVLH